MVENLYTAFNQLLLNDDYKRSIPMITNFIPGKVPSQFHVIHHIPFYFTS